MLQEEAEENRRNTYVSPPARVRDINVIIVGTANFASLGGLGVGIMSVIGRREQERRYLVARENRRRWPEDALPIVTNLMNETALTRCAGVDVPTTSIEHPFNASSRIAAVSPAVTTVATITESMR
jgi:hypothetical protein